MAYVIKDSCISCGACEPECPTEAISAGDSIYVIDADKCIDCGACVPECKFEALDQAHFTDSQIVSQIDQALEKDPHSKIICFACNWCSYAGADFAGVSRIQYAANVRIIRTMCSARVSPDWIDRAFINGAGAVLVSGCHPSDCHYNNANQNTARRVEKYWKRMEKLGVNRDRLRLAWISAAEGAQFAKVINEMEAGIRKLDPNSIETASEALKKRKIIKVEGS